MAEAIVKDRSVTSRAMGAKHDIQAAVEDVPVPRHVGAGTPYRAARGVR